MLQIKELTDVLSSADTAIYIIVNLQPHVVINILFKFYTEV